MRPWADEYVRGLARAYCAKDWFEACPGRKKVKYLFRLTMSDVPVARMVCAHVRNGMSPVAQLYEIPKGGISYGYGLKFDLTYGETQASVIGYCVEVIT